MKKNFRLSFFLLAVSIVPALCQASVTILTNSNPNHTIASGSDEKVYGTSASNVITLESGARAELFYFPGQNNIQIQSGLDLFAVSRSGTMVTFQGSDGTFLKMPATSEAQTISFNGGENRVLQIHNNQVMLDDQGITSDLYHFFRAGSDDRNFFIENDAILVSFMRTNGAIDSIVHKASGVDLRSLKNGAWSSTWAIKIAAADESDSLIQVGNTEKFDAVIRSDEASATLIMTWTGLNLTDGRKLTDASVIAHVSVYSDSPFTHWSLELKGIEDITVLSIWYPYFFGIGPLGKSGEDDSLLYPSSDGILFSNPVRNLKHWWYTYPSGFASMQFMAFFDANAGFYIASEDSDANMKDLIWTEGKPEIGDIGMSIGWRLDGTAHSSVKIPYETVLGTVQGHWSTAAELYKEWAKEQSWTQESLEKQVPSWLSNTSVMMTFSAHGQKSWGAPEQTYTDFVRGIRDNERYFGLPVVGMLWGWEKGGAWAYGDYFPPSEGWENFDRMINDVHSSSDLPDSSGESSRVFLYISPNFLTVSSELWEKGTYQSSLMFDEEGKPRIEPEPEPGVTWAWMDIWTPAWRKHIVDTVETLAEHGVDIVQLDGFPVFPPITCGDDSHGHPPRAGGTWPIETWIEVLSTINQAALSKNPGIAFSGETGAEPYLPYLHLYDSADLVFERDNPDRARNGSRPVPLFEYVYHPSILFFGKMPSEFYRTDDGGSYLRLCIARMLVWGQIPDYQYKTLKLGDPFGDTDSLIYMKDVVTARATYARDYLVYGDMLSAPGFESPDIFIETEFWESGAYSATYRAVQHSAWRGTDGSVGIVLTNIGDETADITLPVQFDRLGLSAGSSYEVRTVDNQSDRLLDAFLTADNSYELSLTPRGILLVKILEL
jgi:hypothetical protein